MEDLWSNWVDVVFQFLVQDFVKMKRQGRRDIVDGYEEQGQGRGGKR